MTGASAHTQSAIPGVTRRIAFLAQTSRLALLAIVVAAGCGPAAPGPEVHDEEPGEREHPAADGGDADRDVDAARDVLVIPSDMLRDLRLTTVAASRRPAEERSLALGELHANEQALAEVAAPIDARIVRVLVAEGDRVQAGAPLVELESVALGRARADLAAAQARSGAAAASAERTQRLAAEHVSSTRERETADAELAAARAEEQAARAALAALGSALAAEASPAEPLTGRFTLTSPLSGVVLSRDAVPGRAVEANTRLLRISDTSLLWLVVHVYERDALRVRTGGTARVELPALPGQPLEGRVTWIGQEVQMPSRTLPVRVEIPNPGLRLRPGLSGSARLPLDEVGASVVTVPAAALQRSEHGWCVFVPLDADRFERRAVGRGRDLGGDVEVVTGLAEGELVVVEGAFLLRAEAARRQGGGGHDDH